MRKLLISLAAAGAALAVASPASAQYYGGQPYGYGQGYNGYGQGYGYNNYGQVRALQARIDRVEWQINRLDRFDRMGDGRAERLREQSRRIEFQLRRAARFGLNPYEANEIQLEIARLEQRVQFATVNGDGRYGRYDRGYYGRDRDNDGDGDRD